MLISLLILVFVLSHGLNIIVLSTTGRTDSDFDSDSDGSGLR